MELEIELDQYKLTVEIIRLVNDQPDPTCRDSADDARGCREVEWKIVYAIEHDDNGRVKECGYLPWWLDKLEREHDSAIEAAVWAKYDEAQERRHDQ